eukprot:5187380-Pleurochrysis_carterae.AAC.1
MAQSSIHTDKIARAAASGAAASFTPTCMMLCECSAERWLKHRSGVKPHGGAPRARVVSPP